MDCRICILFTFTLVVISGCVSFSKEVQEHTLAYNYAQEEIANQMILVNALRAKERRPMHFTILSKVTGSLEIESSGGLTVPFGKNFTEADSVYETSPSVTVASSPSFDVAPENKSEFIKGITTPIDFDLFSDFWQSGWPKDILIYLFVRKIEIIPANVDINTPIKVFINAPDVKVRECNFYQDIPEKNINLVNPENIESDWCKFEAFKDLIDEYLPRIRILEMQRKGTHLGSYNISSATLADLKIIADISTKDGISVDNKKNILSVSLNSKKKRVACLLDKNDSKVYPQDIFSTNAPCESDKASVSRDKSVSQSNDSKYFSLSSKNGDDTGKIVAHFRSAQGAIYYLGELLRAQGEQNLDIICVKGSSKNQSSLCPKDEVPLFIFANDTEQPAAEVAYRDGIVYKVPNENAEPSRSMTVISLLSQVFGLNREASEIPSTGTVNVVN